MAKKAEARRSSGSVDKPPKAGSPQLKKDPVFMRNLEAAVGDEFARASDRTRKDKAVDAPRVAGPQAVGPGTVRTPKRPSKAVSAKTPEPDRKALAAELTSLIPGLDAEGLAFLIEQARVHLYNMRVAELEAAAGEAERASTRAVKLRSSGNSSSAPKAVAGQADGFSIKAASDGSAYDLVWQGKWKMFTGEEMLAMVRIASSKDPVAQVAGRLHRWFSAERSDVFQDIPFSGLADPKLKQLVTLLRNTFKVKGGKQA
jgi:hypothetical protein